MKKVIKELFCLFAISASILMICSTARGASWWSRKWDYRKKLTFDNTTISEDLTNFPVLAHFTSSNFVFTAAQTNGADIRFLDADGTNVLKYEIEKWDKQGTNAWVWVKVPKIDKQSSNDFIYVYYGNSQASDGQDAANVWDENYVGVWHLDETTGTNYDSTTNNNDGTPYPALNPNFDIASCDDSNDWAGTALSLDTNDMIRGNASLVDTVQSPTNGVTYTNAYDPSGSWDFGNRSLNFWFKSSRSNASFDLARVYVYDTNSPANWRCHDLTFITNTWKRFDVGISSGGTNSPTPPASNAIDRIEWQFTAADTVEFTNKIDIVYANGGPVQDAQGKINGADEFDGRDDYVQVPHNAAFNIASTEEITVEVWFYPEYKPNSSVLIDKSSEWMLYGLVSTYEHTKSLQWLIRPDVGGWIYGRNPILGSSKWNHVGVTATKTNMTYFLNGIDQGDQAISVTNFYTTSQPVKISNQWNGNYYKGIIDEVRISNIARSDSWIVAGHLSGNDTYITYGAVELAPPPPGTVMGIR